MRRCLTGTHGQRQPHAAGQSRSAARHGHVQPLQPQSTDLHRRSRQHAATCSSLPVQHPQPQRWRSLTAIVWEGNEQEALRPDGPMAAQHPLWRLMLLSDGEALETVTCCGLPDASGAEFAVMDPRVRRQRPHDLPQPNSIVQDSQFNVNMRAGSVTRHLQLLTGSAVAVDCLAMEPVPPEAGDLPPAVHEMLTDPLLQREVGCLSRTLIEFKCCCSLLLAGRTILL